MKATCILLAVSFLILTGCSTSRSSSHGSKSPDSETVLVTYHVKPGKEAELQAALLKAWEIYRQEHLVFAEPHIVVRDTEDHNKTRFTEIFSWVSHRAPDHAPASVKAIWEQEQSLCEARSGHTAIEGGEVEILIPHHPH